ncbi:MAG: YihY/virulence factor BrkB family protein [Terriglobales bacterium]
MHLVRFFRLVRLALWRALGHDAFGVAKGAAFSSILSLFPALLVVASVAAASRKTSVVEEISRVMARVLPPGTEQTAQVYFTRATDRPVGVLVATSLLTLWISSGVMISWMEGFRNAYQLPKVWGMVKERFIAFGLVIMAGIPLTAATLLVVFGNEIERWAIYHVGHGFGPYILMLWTAIRWLIAILTSIAVMLLIYHHAVPRTQPWHSVLPGSALATAVWFPATVFFGWYVRHFAKYSLLYGSLATAVVLLIWMYIISVIVLIGAEFNALLYPRLAAVPPERDVEESNPRIKVGHGA